MKRLLLLIAVCVGVGLAYLKAYEVTPTQANWSGKVRGDEGYGVGQIFGGRLGAAGDTSQISSMKRVKAIVLLPARPYGPASPGCSRGCWGHFLDFYHEACQGTRR